VIKAGEKEGEQTEGRQKVTEKVSETHKPSREEEKENFDRKEVSLEGRKPAS